MILVLLLVSININNYVLYRLDDFLYTKADYDIRYPRNL